MNQQHTTVPVPDPKGQDKQAGEALSNRYGAEEGVWTKSMLSTLQKGVKGNKWFSLIDKVYADRTLDLAWEKVRANAGACGVDRMSVEHFDKDSPRRLLVIKQQLKEASYQPMPVKRVMIPKPGTSEKRPLGIPAVTDRIVQASLKMVIEPIFEKDFAPNSFGFRPRRSCKDALREVENLLDTGHLHIVDIDIKGYFDAIPHDHLMKYVETRISDGKVLQLIEIFLKQGSWEKMELLEKTDKALPKEASSVHYSLTSTSTPSIGY
jgi:RNA-directed DNA polymerase